MRVGRIEVGLTDYHREPIWKDWLELDYISSTQEGSCGCRILSLGRFYLTWLGDECYSNFKEGWK